MAEADGSRRSVVLVVWLAGCVLVTLAAAGAYVVAQQVGRRAADDVPRALVAQQVAELAQRAVGSRIPSPVPVTALSSQSPPFVIVYDSAHRVVSTSTLLDDGLPGLPDGVLDAAASRGWTSVTWQPRSGVREAVVAQPWAGPGGSGVVVAGVGLAPTEDRARTVLTTVLGGWAVAVLALTAVLLVVARRTAR